MPRETISIRNFTFPKEVQRGQDKEASKCKIMPCQLWGLFFFFLNSKELYVFSSYNKAYETMRTLCPISWGFICSIAIYEYPNVPQGEFCKLTGTKRQL